MLSINAITANASSNTTDKDSNLESKQAHWQGFYVGGVLGELWGKNNATWNPLPSPVAFGASQIMGKNNSSGFVGGILAGYNYQFAKNLISGIEADWSWTNAKGILSSPWTFYGTSNISQGTYSNMESTLNWIPSIRARIGYLMLPKIMVYGAIGVTWGNITYTGNNSNNRNGGAQLYTTNTIFSKTALGYTVGGGLEWAIIRNFFLRAEYLYYQFSSSQNNVAQDTTGHFPAYPSNYVWGNTFVNTARAGLVYKF